VMIKFIHLCFVQYTVNVLCWFLCVCRILDILQKAFWLLLHPLCLLTVVVMTYAALTFSDEPVPELLERGMYEHAF
jgi:hypothetical protein